MHYAHMYHVFLVMSRPAGCTSVQVKAAELSSSLTQNTDKSVVLQKLSLNVDTLRRDKNPLLFLLSINCWLGRMEGSGREQMTPKLENKAFLAKIHTMRTFETP